MLFSCGLTEIRLTKFVSLASSQVWTMINQNEISLIFFYFVILLYLIYFSCNFTLLNKVWKCFTNLSNTFGNHSYLIKLQNITLFEKPLQHNVGFKEHLSICLFLFFLSYGNSLKPPNSLRLIITNWANEMWRGVTFR